VKICVIFGKKSHTKSPTFGKIPTARIFTLYPRNLNFGSLKSEKSYSEMKQN
jgi:hypothetical protein